MRIPEVLKVMGHEFAVSYDGNLIAKEAANGTCCTNTKEIILSPHLGESSTAEVFLHEIFEAMVQMLQIEMEHKDLSAMSELLFSIMRRNGLDFGKSEHAPLDFIR